jgi:hypothetical protein
MTMKKTDLEKTKALKLAQSLKRSQSDRFGKGAVEAPVNRREQRKLDQAKGLVPFACKLDSELIATLKERAANHPDGINGLVGELLQQALGQTGEKA